MALTGPAVDLAAFVGAPVALWVTSTSLGLLLDGALRARLPNSLLTPLGFCLAVVLCLGVYRTGAGNDLLLPVLGALVLAGLFVARRDLPGRLNGGWPLLAAVAAYLLFDVSEIAHGGWTIIGYHLQDDSAYELLLTRHLQAHGTHLGTLAPSTATSFISGFLATGYPLGGQAYLAALSGLTHSDPAVLWQGYLSSLAAVGAMAAASLAEAFTERRVAALVGVLAMGAALTFQYALQGAIKETSVTVAVLCALALTRYAIVRMRGIPAAVIVAAPLAAILAVYSAAGLPYAVAIAGAGLAATSFVHRCLPSRTWLWPSVAGTVAFLVFATPALLTIKKFFDVATTLYSSGSASTVPPLGQLLRPLPLSETVGVWLAGDYRVAVAAGTLGQLEVIATVALLVLLGVGVLRALARREAGLLIAVVSMAGVLLIVYTKAIPYAQAKILSIASPTVVLGAAQGLAAIWRRVTAPVVALAAAGLAAGILFSDALAYHAAPVAPTGRFIALRQVGDRLGPRGPVLMSEFEEFAKYFMDGTPLNVGSEYPTPRNTVLRVPGGLYDKSFDLDEEQLAFVESFPYIVVRRSPQASRPPANYTLIYSNAYYELWQRRSAPSVLLHQPIQGFFQASGPVPCRSLAASVRHAPSGAKLAVASAPVGIGYDLPSATDRSPGWFVYPTISFPVAVTTKTPGHASKRITVRRGGRMRIWVEGTFPRTIDVSLDGRRIGSVLGNNTPGEWLEGGRATVSAGSHELELRRGGGGFAPGDGGTGVNDGHGDIGAVLLVPEEPRRLSILPVGAWRSVCRRPADWVELVKG